MEEIKISNLVITEKDREFTYNIGKGENITIRIPLPSKKAQIISQIARFLGGIDAKCFQPDDYNYIRMIVTLNSIIVESPEWWPGAEECPDEELLIKLWNFYLISEEKFKEQRLKKNNKK